MLETIRQDLTLLNPDGQLEFMQRYYIRRAEDMLKPSTYNPGVKAKKAKIKANKKPKIKKEKMVNMNKLSNLDAVSLALLKKAGIQL